MRMTLRHGVLAVMLVGFAACPVLAQSGASLVVRTMPDDVAADSVVDLVVVGQGDTGNPDSDGSGTADVQMSILDIAGRIHEGATLYRPRVGYDYTLMRIDSDDPVLPDQLVDMAVGVGYALPDMGDYIGGIAIGLGYTGDGPFGDPQAFYGKAAISYGKKLDENREIGLVLDYDGNRTVMPDVPLPGFAYRQRIDNKLNLVAGLPVSSVEWRPYDELMFELVYTMTDRLDIRATHSLTRVLSLYGSFEQRREAFEMDELDDHDRLLFEQRRAEAGIRLKATETTSLLVAGGYAFGQKFSIGYDFGSEDEVADLSDEPYLRLSFESRF
jgi:hypothetical protein